jgi:hypothetical protein
VYRESKGFERRLEKAKQPWPLWARLDSQGWKLSREFDATREACEKQLKDSEQ